MTKISDDIIGMHLYFESTEMQVLGRREGEIILRECPHVGKMAVISNEPAPTMTITEIEFENLIIYQQGRDEYKGID